MLCCVVATPIARDYQRYLEPIQCVEVERLPRLPGANEMGRVGRQVMLMFRCLTPDGIFLTVDRALCMWMVVAGGHALYYKLVELRRCLREFHDPLCIGFPVL